MTTLRVVLTARGGELTREEAGGRAGAAAAEATLAVAPTVMAAADGGGVEEAEWPNPAPKVLCFFPVLYICKYVGPYNIL
jgi:hypothetical protein